MVGVDNKNNLIAVQVKHKCSKDEVNEFFDKIDSGENVKGYFITIEIKDKIPDKILDDKRLIYFEDVIDDFSNDKKYLEKLYYGF